MTFTQKNRDFHGHLNSSVLELEKALVHEQLRRAPLLGHLLKLASGHVDGLLSLERELNRSEGQRLLQPSLGFRHGNPPGL